MVAAHEKEHGVRDADGLLCLTVEGVLTESREYKEFIESDKYTKAAEADKASIMDSFCTANFGEVSGG
jgi:hypothetical protein